MIEKLKVLKVLVVDRRELFRTGLVKLLQGYPNVNVVFSGSSGRECIEKAIELRPDVIVLDTEITDCEFVEVIRQTKNALPDTHIIILTHSTKEGDLFTAISAGVSVFLSKDTEVIDFIRAISRVVDGEVTISPPMATKLIEEFRRLERGKVTSAQNHGFSLSKREVEVLTLVTRGYSNKKIAKALFITENTVKVHLSNIMEKLHVNNRQQAALKALETGIVSQNSRKDSEEKLE